VTTQNIREANAARNIVVINLLRRYGLAEDQGRGVDVMQDTSLAGLLSLSSLHHDCRATG
jgi:predicted HTH transcriptional regulator